MMPICEILCLLTVDNSSHSRKMSEIGIIFFKIENTKNHFLQKHQKEKAIIK